MLFAFPTLPEPQLQRHRIKPIQKTRMNKRIVSEMSPLWVGRYVIELVLKVIMIADSMRMESWLPNFSGKLRPHLMGKSTLDALSATLNGLIEGRTQQHMQMIGHDGESVHLVALLVAIVKQRIKQKFGICGSHEKSASLVGRRCERVSVHRCVEKHTSEAKAHANMAGLIVRAKALTYQP
jgi:hypothetical protein